jgi:tRNA(Arg) A34 adenosine deaminase TadA/aspartate/methionine/tyrosine aminotransferase
VASEGESALDERFMALALEEARLAEHRGDVPVGAVAVVEGKVVAVGHNRREQDADPTAHAEIVCLREAARRRRHWRLGGLTLYVTLEPCPMCAGALVLARVDRVVFGCRDPKGGACETLFRIGRDERLNHRFEVVGGVLEAACASQLKAFFAARRAAPRAAQPWSAVSTAAVPAWGFSARTAWLEQAPVAAGGGESPSGTSADSVDLTETNPTRVGLETPERLASLVRGTASYDPDPLGERRAREAVAEFYAARGHVVDPAEVLLTASTSEAYGLLFKLLCDAGDDVLVPTPSYPLFDCLAQLEGVGLRRYALSKHDGFRVDVAAVAQNLGPRTRAIVVVAPNNPTGTVLHERDAAALERLARDRGLALIVDEVFAETLAAAGARAAGAEELRRSFASSDEALTFVLSGLSKVLCAPGAKLAWTLVRGPAAPRREALRRLEIAADAYLSPSAAVQRALPELLAHEPTVRAELGARLATNRRTLETACAGSAVTVLPAHGGWCALLEVPRVLPLDEWVVELANGGVRVLSGELFDIPGERTVVLSLLPSTEAFTLGVGRLLDVVARRAGG